MAFTSWRGVVGCIKPTLRPGGLEELIRMLPEGIGVLPLVPQHPPRHHRRVQARRRAVRAVGQDSSPKPAATSSIPRALRRSCCLDTRARPSRSKAWEKTYKVPFFTSGSNHVRALACAQGEEDRRRHLLRRQDQRPVRELLQASRFQRARRWMASMCRSTRSVSSRRKRSMPTSSSVFLKHRNADAIYLLGTGWRVLPIDRSAGAGSGRSGGASGAGALLGDPATAFDPSAGEGLWSLAGRDGSGVNEGRRECGSVVFRGHVGTTRQELDWKAFQSGRSGTDFQSKLTRKAPAGHLLRRPRECEDPYLSK